MDELSQQKLDEILKKEVAALTVNDRAFLRARISYIPKKHEERLKSVLREKAQVEKKPRSSGLRAYQLLQKKAKTLGIPYKGIKAEDLKAHISSVEGPGSVE